MANESTISSGVRTDVEVVTDFLAALAAGDLDRALPLLGPGVEWLNTGMPAVRGEKVTEALRLMVRRNLGFDAVIHHIASDGTAVLTDRTDVLIAGRVRTEFRVCGTFIVHNGQIARWDDQFSARDLVAGFFRRTVGRR